MQGLLYMINLLVGAETKQGETKRTALDYMGLKLDWIESD